MRFIETKKLADYIQQVGGFFGEANTDTLAERVEALPSVCLQSFSIEHDQSFLREVSAVLNVIVSIIYHPHISNKREEVIIRVEQAQQVSQEAFLDTIKDPRLWKKHDVKMIPEELHYHQYEDELRIYENRFIGFLVDVIDRELAKYSAFYLSRLPTLTRASGAADDGKIGAVIMQIDRLRRKSQFIKGTHFYKEVSRGKPISPKIQPTNILLKDRLYRFCFKFYRKIARYEDMNAARNDLRSYYTILLLRQLCRRGFVPTAAEQGSYTLESADFRVDVSNTEDGALILEVACPSIPDAAPSRHLLGFYVETELRIGESDTVEDGFDSTEMLSVWELSCAEGGASRFVCAGSEEELAEEWLATKINKVVTDPSVYKKYCPVCRGRGVEHKDSGEYVCPACASRYVFGNEGGVQTVWFKKIARR